MLRHLRTDKAMWIRSAFWTGKPKPGAEIDFVQAMNDDIIPAFRLIPAVDRALVLWPQRREDGPPDIYCQIIVEFSSKAALEEMLASSQRLALRPKVVAVAALFDGGISHIDYEVA